MKTKNHAKYRLGRLILTGILSHFLMGFAIAAPSIASVSSLKGNVKNGKDAYHTCAICHTPQGWGTENGYYPQLSGQHPNVLIKQLIDIKMGNRAVPTMVPFSDEIFDKGHQNVADVVSYISSLPMTPNNSVGKGDNLILGEELYAKQCQSCHGEKAEGNNEKIYPLLQGQHYQYLLRQMQWIKQGIRINGDEKMRQAISTYTDTDMQAIADYISRIKPDKNKVAESTDWQNPDFHDNFVSVPGIAPAKVKNNKQ